MATVILAAILGATAWSGPMPLIGLAYFLPHVTRKHPLAAAFAYYASATWPTIPAAKAFLPTTTIKAIAIWLAASAILALPWLLPRHIALASTAITGIASPFIAAGVLFPGLGWLSLAAVALPVRFSLPLALAANLLHEPIPAPNDWSAINTANGKYDIESAHTKYVLLPENTIRNWTEATEAFWPTTSKTVVIGVTIPDGEQTWNAALVPGTKNIYRQRIPVPTGHLPLNPLGPGTLQVGEHKAAILICFEQLLVWPVLHSMAEQPTIILALTNASWTKRTPVPAVQESATKAWSRLFNIPAVTATNY
jgi:hypothetical protein